MTSAKDHGSCDRCSKPARYLAGGYRLCDEHGSFSAVFGDLGLTNISQIQEPIDAANRLLEESRHTNRLLAKRIVELEEKLARAREINRAAIAGQRQFFTSGMSSPTRWMYSLCSNSLSCICCFKYAQRCCKRGTRSMTSCTKW